VAWWQDLACAFDKPGQQIRCTSQLPLYSLETSDEQIQVIHLRNLINKRWQTVHEGIGVEVVQDIEINSMLAASEESGSIAPAKSIGESAILFVKGIDLPPTHARISRFKTSRTNGLGLIVSRFPRGICSTRLMALGTTVTI
jgi:hypothetical protein